MAKKKSNTVGIFAKIFLGIPLGLFLLILILLIVPSAVKSANFDNAKTQVTKDGMEIVTDTGTCSAGSHWETAFYGDDAVEITNAERLSQGFFTATQIKELYQLKAKKAGHTTLVIYSMSGGGNYCDAEIFDIKADDNMHMEYSSQKVSLLRLSVKSGETEWSTDRMTSTLTNAQTKALDIPLCGEFCQDKAEHRDDIPKIKYDNNEYYIDVEKGRIDCFDFWNENGRVFILNETMLPYYREIFAKIS